MDHWQELDAAAKANLSLAGLDEFHRYKAQLQAEGHKWDGDAEEILSGFIWDQAEFESLFSEEI